jgi:hypothetical protein
VISSGSGQQPGPQEDCWQIPNPHFMGGLPHDPGQLYARLRADSPDDRPGYVRPFAYAADALRSGRVPADLRAALYRALLLLPGIKITEAPDQDGAPRIALAIDDGARRNEIFIDPDNEASLLSRGLLGVLRSSFRRDGAIARSSGS